MAQVGKMVKEGIAQELTFRLSSRPNFFVASIDRLKAFEADQLRQKLFGSKAELIMIKRRISMKALASLKLDGLEQMLEGSVGVILAGDDVLPAAKTLVEFFKSHEEQLAVRGGVIDGQLLGKSSVEELAMLPSKPILLAQVVGTIEAPISDVIFTIEQLIGDVAWVTEQAAAQKPLPAQQSDGQAGAAASQPAGDAGAAPAEGAAAGPAQDGTAEGMAEGPAAGGAPSGPTS